MRKKKKQQDTTKRQLNYGDSDGSSNIDSDEDNVYG